MKITLFLLIFLVTCTIFGIVAVPKLGNDFLSIYVVAVVVGAIGGAYTIHHHPGDDDD